MRSKPVQSCRKFKMRQSLLLSSEPSRTVTVQALSCWAFLYRSGRNILREKKLSNWCAPYISIWPLLVVETDLFKFKQVRLLCPISRMLLWQKSSSSFCAWTKRWLWAQKMIFHYSTKVYAHSSNQRSSFSLKTKQLSIVLQNKLESKEQFSNAI